MRYAHKLATRGNVAQQIAPGTEIPEQGTIEAGCTTGVTNSQHTHTRLDKRQAVRAKSTAQTWLDFAEGASDTKPMVRQPYTMRTPSGEASSIKRQDDTRTLAETLPRGCARVKQERRANALQAHILIDGSQPESWKAPAAIALTY
jgi:hypothetical protein